MEQSIGKKSASNDSAYYRVRVEIPLRTTSLNASDVGRRASEVLSHVDPPVPEVEPALIAWLDRIERKLDRLLAHEHLADDHGIGLTERVDVDLSATSLHFTSKEPIILESAMLLEFELPEVPVRLVRCIGRVAETTQSDLSPGGYRTRIDFETIRQADRDAVVRYALSVQRQTIRSHTQQRGDSG